MSGAHLRMRAQASQRRATLRRTTRRTNERAAAANARRRAWQSGGCHENFVEGCLLRGELNSSGSDFGIFRETECRPVSSKVGRCRMQSSNLFKTIFAIFVALAAIYLGSSLLLARGRFNSAAAAETKSQACPSNDSGLSLPTGFCATVFADDIGHARHLVVAPGGVLYVNTWSGDYYGNDTPHAGGFLVALQDKGGTGKADVIERFGETVQSGGHGGTGIGMYKEAIYAELNDRIARYSLPAGSIAPSGSADTIVSRLPFGGAHPMHPFLINAEGALFVDVASATNSCQLKNRTLKSPGASPCTELETRGGIWRYDANKTNQPFTPADRYATGIRNGEGFAIDATGKHLFVTQHGRDQLHANWPDLYKLDQEATLPAEE